MPPMPKRSEHRRRTNAVPGLTRTPSPGPVPRAPAANRDWHPAVKRWYASLRRSGQSHWYEPSDWAQAWLVADALSRELTSGEPMRVTALQAFLTAADNLLTTEGARRRAHLELTRDGGSDGADDRAEHVVRGIFGLAGA